MFNLLSVGSVFSYIGYIVVAIIVLLFMVLIHELGHYIAGKILKFKINEFSIGFGPKLFQKKKKDGELVSLRLLPLGGYCAFEGENEDGTENKEAFNNQKPWKRLIVLFFGAFFNFLSAIIFSFILLLASGYDLVQVKHVAPESMNYAIIQEGDVIYGVDGKKIDFVKDDYFSTLVADHIIDKYTVDDSLDTTTGIECTINDKIYYLIKDNITYNIIRDGEKIEIVANINIYCDENGKVFNDKGEAYGYSLLNTNEDNGEFEIKSYKYSFGEALIQAVPFTVKWAWKVLVIFGQLLTGKLALTSLGGPVTTINMIAKYTQMSFSYLLLLMPVIAVNLAVFNLLPIPALDGCQMLFVTIEWIRRKPIKRSVINWINNIGLIALLGLVVIVDILQFVL